jgi:hypothetical protein
VKASSNVQILIDDYRPIMTHPLLFPVENLRTLLCKAFRN